MLKQIETEFLNIETKNNYDNDVGMVDKNNNGAYPMEYLETPVIWQQSPKYTPDMLLDDSFSPTFHVFRLLSRRLLILVEFVMLLVDDASEWPSTVDALVAKCPLPRVAEAAAR